MSLARMPQAISMKYQLPLEKSGSRKWKCYHTNLNQTLTFLSQISLSPSPPRCVRSLSLSTVVSYGIGDRDKQYCQSNPSQLGPQNRGLWQIKCAHRMPINSFEEFLNNKIKEALKPEPVPEPNPKVREKRPGIPDNDSDERNSKKLKVTGDSNLNNGTISGGDLAMHVDHEKKGDGEYVLNIRTVNQNSMVENKVEMAERMAKKAALLLLYGEMLLDMGNKLRAQSRASLSSAFQRPVSSNSESDY